MPVSSAYRVPVTGRSMVSFPATHSTLFGDLCEHYAQPEAFGDNLAQLPWTEALSSHSLDVATVHGKVCIVLMQRDDYVIAGSNMEQLDPAAENCPILSVDSASRSDTLQSNSFGFGGINASLGDARS